MAQKTQTPDFAYEDDPFNTNRAWRLGIWAAVAVLATGGAWVAAFTDAGAHLATRIASQPDQGRQFDNELEARRLAETVRLLAADRDRLLARVSTLEHNLGDVTGALGAVPAGARPLNGTNPTSATPPMLAPAPTVASPGVPAPLPAIRPIQPPPGGAPVNQGQEAISPQDRATPADSSGSVVTKTEFGVDLGGAATVDGLRALWTLVKSGNDSLFEGLRPVMAVRDGTKPGTLELRLVAGPLNNAGAAARLCAGLVAAGLSCQPTVFDGQRLALR